MIDVTDSKTRFEWLVKEHEAMRNPKTPPKKISWGEFCLLLSRVPVDKRDRLFAEIPKRNLMFTSDEEYGKSPVVAVVWPKPEEGKFKVNVDVGYDKVENMLIIAIIIRDWDGNLRFLDVRRVSVKGHFDAIKAENDGIKVGCKVATEEGFLNFDIECDSLHSVRQMQGYVKGTYPMTRLFWIPREANGVANETVQLAKKEISNADIAKKIRKMVQQDKEQKFRLRFKK